MATNIGPKIGIDGESEYKAEDLELRNEEGQELVR